MSMTPGCIGIDRLALAYGLAGRRVLDVACGTGKSFAPLLQRGYAVTACDVSPRMAALAKAPCGRSRPRLRRRHARLPALDPFDLITCLDDAVCHLLSAQDVLAALHGIRRNLAPGGLAVFDVALPQAYAEAADAIAGDDRHVVLWRAPEAPRSGGRGARRRVHGAARRPLRAGAAAPAPPAPRVDVLRALAARAGLAVLAVHGQQAAACSAPISTRRGTARRSSCSHDDERREPMLFGP